METRATEENILKYYETLKRLHQVLTLTDKISMLKFSEQMNITKNLSTVLQKGGVIKCEGKGRATKWSWTTIEPNRQMAVETLKRLATLNPPRNTKKTNRGGKREGAGRKTRLEESVIPKLPSFVTVKTWCGTFKFQFNYTNTSK